MPKKKKEDRRFSNPDFRHQVSFPAPSIAEIEERLMQVLTPGVFTPLQIPEEKKKLRERILTLPVMTAITVTLVGRKVSSLTEIVRILAEEDMLWVTARQVSKQALSKRFESLPAGYFAQLFEQVSEQLRQERETEQAKEKFAAVWIADGSTLEALQKKTEKLKEQTDVLAGKIMMIVEAFSHLPVATFYNKDANANDKQYCQQLVEKVPEGGLLIFDLGFFSFPFFDEFTEAKKYFLTRLREKTAYKVVETLSQGARFRDEIIEMGKYRSNPCKHKVRMVSVLWNEQWYHYLTNVLDPQMLSAKEVVEYYRRRWRIEDAFLLTKRLLGLSYLWVGGTNGVEIQLYATWIFYAVLTDLCDRVAKALQQPLERISVEMVFRSLYHFNRALLRGVKTDVITYITGKAKLFGLVKAERKRHRLADLQNQLIWEAALS